MKVIELGKNLIKFAYIWLIFLKIMEVAKQPIYRPYIDKPQQGFFGNNNL